MVVERVVIGDEVEAFRLVLQSNVLADGAEVVAEMKFAGRLHAAQDAARGRLRRRHDLSLYRRTQLHYTRTFLPGTLFAAKGRGVPMTDRVTEVLIAALKQALADPAAAWRLYKSGKLDGLFPGRGGVGGEAAAPGAGGRAA